METNQANEIILYQPDEALRLEFQELDRKVDFFVRTSLQPKETISIGVEG